jgi:hypothetical protein
MSYSFVIQQQGRIARSHEHLLADFLKVQGKTSGLNILIIKFPSNLTLLYSLGA